MANPDYEEERYCEANCPVLVVGRSSSPVNAELLTMADDPALPSYHGMDASIYIRMCT